MAVITAGRCADDEDLFVISVYRRWFQSFTCGAITQPARRIRRGLHKGGEDVSHDLINDRMLLQTP